MNEPVLQFQAAFNGLGKFGYGENVDGICVVHNLCMDIQIGSKRLQNISESWSKSLETVTGRIKSILRIDSNYSIYYKGRFKSLFSTKSILIVNCFGGIYVRTESV